MPEVEYTIKPCLIDISEDDDLSESVSILGFQLVGLAMPAGWDAASIGIQIDPGDGTFRVVYDADGTALALTVAASYYVLLSHNAVLVNTPGADVPIIPGANLKLSASAAQLADRTIWLVLKPL